MIDRIGKNAVDPQDAIMQGVAMKETDKNKKQVPLRLSPSLYAELMQWAEADFRSLNGQIEYLLTEAVKKRKGPKPKRKREDN